MRRLTDYRRNDFGTPHVGGKVGAAHTVLVSQ
jgi:hypothetical protein